MWKKYKSQFQKWYHNHFETLTKEQQLDNLDINNHKLKIRGINYFLARAQVTDITEMIDVQRSVSNGNTTWDEVTFEKELTEETRRESIASVAEIQETLTAILRGDIKEQQIVVEGCGDGISEAVTKERSAQLKDRIKAGETLAKMFGAFDNSVKVNVSVPVFIDDVKE